MHVIKSSQYQIYIYKYYDFSLPEIGLVKLNQDDSRRLLFPIGAKKPSILESYENCGLVDLVDHWNTHLEGYH